jgi:prepilin signal peptidase PulO-like enzyme (type II secretory pathway)
MEVIADWAQREDAPDALRKPAEGLGRSAQARSQGPALQHRRPALGVPKCNHAITALENIPVVSWVWLRGRCRGCGARIRARYPLIEAVTGIVSGYLAWRFGFTLATLGGLVFCWILIAATFIDFDTQLLPDDLTLPLLWTGLLFNMGGVFTSLSSAVVGAVAGYLALWSVYWAFKLATGQRRHGLRRLQTARRHRRMAGLENAARRYSAFLCGGRNGGDRADRACATRTACSDSVRSLSRRGGRAGPVLG